jgi:predicted RNA binding protein YcfA (HicA-like mRNA interferase family)
VPLKVGEIIKVIGTDGWYLIATRGSHRQYKHPDKPGRVTVAGKPSDTCIRALNTGSHSNEHERRPMNDTATRIYCTSLRQGF